MSCSSPPEGQLVHDLTTGKYVRSRQLLCLYAIQVVAAVLKHSVRCVRLMDHKCGTPEAGTRALTKPLHDSSG